MTSSTSTTVLLVEDEPGLLELYRIVLNGAGFIVLTAPSADEAIQIARSYPDPIHVLLTDLVLSERLHLGRDNRRLKHGLTLIQKIEAMRPGIKSVLYSAQPPEVIEGFGLIRHVPFLRKPFSREMLLATVREVLRGPQESVANKAKPSTTKRERERR